MGSISEEFQQRESKVYEDYIQAAIDPNCTKPDAPRAIITSLA